MSRDEGWRSFDPLGFSGVEGRRRADKGSLQAIKIGVDDLDVDVHTELKEEEEPAFSTAAKGVAKGWDYWKYRALLLGVALLWGTNFPAVRPSRVPSGCRFAIVAVAA